MTGWAWSVPRLMQLLLGVALAGGMVVSLGQFGGTLLAPPGFEQPNRLGAVRPKLAGNRSETVPPTVVRPTDGDRQDDARRRMHGRSQVAQVVARLRRRECHRQPIEVQWVSKIDPHGAGIAIRSPIG